LLNIIFRFSVDSARTCAKLEHVCKAFYAAINSEVLTRNTWAELIYDSKKASSTCWTNSKQQSAATAVNNNTNNCTASNAPATQFYDEFQATLKEYLASSASSADSATAATSKLFVPRQIKFLAEQIFYSFRTVSSDEALAFHKSELLKDPNAFIKLVMLGSGGVGKSAVTIQFIQGNFIECYDPTIEDSYRKQIHIQQQPIMLDIVDSCGQEDYESRWRRDAMLKSSDAFILVYSITDPTSFVDAIGFIVELERLMDCDMRDIPCVLVGNKLDLADEERGVTAAEGEKLASKHGMPFFEASAKKAVNIDSVFEAVVMSALQNRVYKTLPFKHRKLPKNSNANKKQVKCIAM